MDPRATNSIVSGIFWSKIAGGNALLLSERGTDYSQNMNKGNKKWASTQNSHPKYYKRPLPLSIKKNSYTHEKMGQSLNTSRCSMGRIKTDQTTKCWLCSVRAHASDPRQHQPELERHTRMDCDELAGLEGFAMAEPRPRWTQQACSLPQTTTPNPKQFSHYSACCAKGCQRPLGWKELWKARGSILLLLVSSNILPLGESHLWMKTPSPVSVAGTRIWPGNKSRRKKMDKP